MKGISTHLPAKIEADTKTLIEQNKQPSNKYNGWRNFETWLLRLNLDNDYGLYSLCQEYFEENKKVDVFELSRNFKEYLEELFGLTPE